MTVLGLMVGAAGLSAAGETFTAKATTKVAAKNQSAPITISIDRFLTDAERDKIVSVAKANDAAATRKALAAMPDIGYIELAVTPAKRVPIKYAYARSTGSGRMVTVVAAEPLLHLGGTLPDAKPKAGYDLALALLVLDGSDKGTGELAPAVKVKADANGAVVTDDYGAEAVRLVDIAKK